MQVIICDKMRRTVAELLVQQGIDNGQLTEEMREAAIEGLMESADNVLELELTPAD